MLSQPLRTALESAIGRATGAPFAIARATAASGGCIHSSWVLESGAARYFAKTNDAVLAATLAAEADGLAALAGAGMRVPRPIAQGEAAGKAFLVLEYLPLASGNAGAFRELGRGLARLHHSSRGDAFGWHRDNFIGLTPQSNTLHASWAEFWQRGRLAPQLELAARNGYRGELQSLGRRVMDVVPALLRHAVAPSLLHGDLWGGNAGCLDDGTPVVFDPAVYYGDGEADLAMTELFGGFPGSFYDGYREVRPIDEDGYRRRRVLYNLYHVLNHLNLFGEEYRAQAERMMEKLLAA